MGGQWRATSHMFSMTVANHERLAAILVTSGGRRYGGARSHTTEQTKTKLSHKMDGCTELKFLLRLQAVVHLAIASQR